MVITHYLGAGDRNGAEDVAHNALGINVWLGLFISIMTFTVFGTDAGVTASTAESVAVCAPFPRL